MNSQIKEFHLWKKELFRFGKKIKLKLLACMIFIMRIKITPDELQIEHDKLTLELRLETMNLLENYMQPEDICFVLSGNNKDENE